METRPLLEAVSTNPDTTILDSLIQHYRQSGLVKILLRDYDTREHILSLNFVISALDHHAAQIRGDKIKVDVLLRWFRVAREMEHIHGLPFNIVDSVQSHLQSVKSLQPVPNGDAVQKFLMDLDAVTATKIDETMTLRDFGLMVRTAKPNDATIAQHQQAALATAVGGFQRLGDRYSQYPICTYFINVMIEACKNGQHGLGLLYNVFYSSGIKDQGWFHSKLAWTILAYRLDALVVGRFVTVADCQSVSLAFAEPLRESMLTFLWSLTQLNSVMSTHIDQAKEFKAKVLAGCVTVGVPVVQVLFRMLAESDGFESTVMNVTQTS